MTSIEEALAWVGRRYEGIRKLDRNDLPSAYRILREAEAGSYLVISEKIFTSLLEGKEPIPCTLILNGKVGHEKMMLLRLKGNVQAYRQSDIKYFEK